MSKYPISQGDYIKHRGLVCPNCGDNTGVESDEIEVCDGGATQNCNCTNCGAIWTDEYELTGYDNLFIPKEK